MKIKHEEIKKWFDDNYEGLVESDRLSISHSKNRSGKPTIEVKVLLNGVKIGWFENENDESFFPNAKIHLDWQFCIKR